MADPTLAAVFKRPFAEQVEFFRGKLGNLVPTQRWDDLWKEAHDTAFMVAGAQKADLLADLAGAVEKAIVNGIGIGEFRKQFDAAVAKAGWSYKGERNWRTRIIYQTNISTSYAAGREQQIADGGFPFKMYKHSDSVLNPRPEHVSWDGLVLPVTHPFWQTHSAPNGWGCKCRIVGIRNEAAARRLGGKWGKQPPDGWDDIDAKTGEQVGIDKGWGYQPGASVLRMRQQIAAKAAKLPEPLASALMADVDAINSMPLGIDDFVNEGRRITGELPDPGVNPSAFFDALLDRMERDVGISKACKTASGGEGAKLVKSASRRYPDAWTEAADAMGPLYTKVSAKTRGHCFTSVNPAWQGKQLKLQDFGVVSYEEGAGYLMARKGDLGNAVHEYAHRLQRALPGLDDQFQQMHRRRTAGEPIKRLKDLVPGSGYGAKEVTREDHYINPYQGKEYNGGSDGGALEVMTMSFENLLGHEAGLPPSAISYRNKMLQKFYTEDREMFDFTVGLLFKWKP